MLNGEGDRLMERMLWVCRRDASEPWSALGIFGIMLPGVLNCKRRLSSMQIVLCCWWVNACIHYLA